jgi:hypothetical protein
MERFTISTFSVAFLKSPGVVPDDAGGSAAFRHFTG